MKSSEGGSATGRPHAGILYATLMGAVCATLGAFPAAGLVALVYGFPIPFVGNLRGLEAVVPSQMAVVFYGLLLGGFFVLGAAGAVLGAIAFQAAGPDRRRVTRLSVSLGLLVALAGAIFLAVLDLIIGPW